jgi:hypothetical protein
MHHVSPPIYLWCSLLCSLQHLENSAVPIYQYSWQP